MRFRKSHFSSGEILVLEREEAESNGCFSKTGVGVGLMATERRKKKLLQSLTSRKSILLTLKWTSGRSTHL